MARRRRFRLDERRRALYTVVGIMLVLAVVIAFQINNRVEGAFIEPSGPVQGLMMEIYGIHSSDLQATPSGTYDFVVTTDKQFMLDAPQGPVQGFLMELEGPYNPDFVALDGGLYEWIIYPGGEFIVQTPEGPVQG